MNFDLTPEQRMIQESVRVFMEEEVAPFASEADATREFPMEYVAKMAKMGLLGMPVPKEYSGGGTDMISYILALEEIARTWAALAVIVAVHTSVGTLPILRYGSEEQKRKYVPPLAKGEMVGGFAITEPEAGSDAMAIQTKAERKGEGYVLNGAKCFISNGPDAGCLIITAMTDRSKGSRGLSTFIVEKNTPGFTIGKIEEKMGMHADVISELIFEDCYVPQENLLGGEGAGLKVALSALDGGRIGIAAQCVGIARGALEESVKYAKEREQFGRPIAKFQAIQWKLADMAVKVDAARLLVHKAAYLKDTGSRYTREASMAKLFASEAAMENATDAIQIHGGYGYTEDYVVERYFRDAKVTQIYEGTSEIQRLVIARDVIR